MIRIKYIGQNGFVITKDGKSICFDPYLSNCVYELTGSGVRNYESPSSPEELSKTDLYFISHNHLDHLDPYTIKNVAMLSNKTKFICPYPYIDELKSLGVEDVNIIGARIFDKIEYDGIKAIAVPEKHEDYTIINGEHGNLGYIVEWDGVRIFHAGDAIADKKLADDLKQFEHFDIMFLPINGHDWKRFNNDTMGNMTYREALDLCDYVGTDLVVPMHYDLFGNNTENPAFFVDYLYREYPRQKFKMFMPGEEIILDI
jgi:L-ascorbate metabolism protein UlaG (beta-lactamase superfamily)